MPLFTAASPDFQGGLASRRGAGAVERGGLENRCTGNRTVGSNPTLSAICPRESVLPIRLRPDFLVVLEGYAGGALHLARRVAAKIGLSGPIFSEPVDCAGLVNCVQATDL